jgi:predicted Zn-dependent protease
MLLAVRHALRIVAWVVGLVALPVVLAAALAQIGLVFALALDVVAVLWAWLWLARSAHGMFETGRFRNAARRYRILAAVTRSAERERAALLSRVGCHVAAGELEVADRLLATVDANALDAQERAVWLNNRACAVLARGGDPHAALALVDEATALRPDVPALQHTRGTALLAVGRIDDAIAVLDGMRAGGELAPRLEAERCKELALAWTRKGESAYAEDYQLRADALGR